MAIFKKIDKASLDASKPSLEAGDSIPADGRIIEEASMKVEEAALT